VKPATGSSTVNKLEVLYRASSQVGYTGGLG